MKTRSTSKRVWIQHLFILFVLLFIVLVSTSQAEENDEPLMSPAAYDLSWWTIDGGGGVNSSGGGYDLGGTIGQADVGMSSAGGYTLTGGCWPGAIESGAVPPCAIYDLNHDGFIDLDDINLVIYNSIFANQPYNPTYDLIPDGIVDIADVFEVAIHFGESCP